MGFHVNRFLNNWIDYLVCVLKDALPTFQCGEGIFPFSVGRAKDINHPIIGDKLSSNKYEKCLE